MICNSPLDSCTTLHLFCCCCYLLQSILLCCPLFHLPNLQSNFSHSQFISQHFHKTLPFPVFVWFSISSPLTTLFRLLRIGCLPYSFIQTLINAKFYNSHSHSHSRMLCCKFPYLIFAFLCTCKSISNAHSPTICFFILFSADIHQIFPLLCLCNWTISFQARYIGIWN